MSADDVAAQNSALWDAWLDKYVKRLNVDMADVADVAGADRVRRSVMESTNPRYVSFRALSLPVYHRPQITRLHSALFSAAISIFQLNLKSTVRISLSKSLFHVFLGCPLSLWLCGVQCRTCLAILSHGMCIDQFMGFKGVEV